MHEEKTSNTSNSVPIFSLIPRPEESFEPKQVPLLNKILLGRSIHGGANSSNGFFESVQVSRQHATVSFESGKFYIEDKGSLNGTFLNKVKLNAREKTEISCFDILQLGQEGPYNSEKMPMVGMIELHPCLCTNKEHDSIVPDTFALEANIEQKSSKYESEEGFSQELMPMSEVLSFGRAEAKRMKEVEEEQLKQGKEANQKEEVRDIKEIMYDPDLFSLSMLEEFRSK